MVESIASREASGIIDAGCSDSVGARLQMLRKKFGLSQRELARRAEVTNSTLSMIEQSKVSPSVGSLEKILHAFPISLQEFFSESFGVAPAVTRVEHFVKVTHDEIDHRILPLTMGNRRDSMYIAEQRYPPGAKVESEWMAHNGFIGAIVIAGEIELHIDGVKYCLLEGDGFNFSLHRDHVFINSGTEECRIICVSFSD